MDNAEIQAKLKKLENIEQKRRERAKRYVQKRKEQGRRQISAIIPDSIFQVIQAKKQELGLSTGQIIEEAITKTYVNIVACTDDNLELTIENTNDSTDVIKSTIQTKDNHKPTVTEKNPPEKKDLITPPSKYPNNQHDLPLGDAGQEENLDSPDLEDEPDFSGPGEAPAPEPKKTQPGATAFKKPEPVKEMDVPKREPSMSDDHRQQLCDCIRECGGNFEGEMGHPELAEELDRRGLLSPIGEKWTQITKTKMKKILTDFIRQHEDTIRAPMMKKKEEAEKKITILAPLPNCHGKKMTTEERDVFLFQVEQLFPGKGQNAKRAEALNNAGILTGSGRQWTDKYVMDNLGLAKKRLKKKN